MDTSPRTSIKPPFAYYGGKAKLASRIVAMMPPHRVYTEAYAGSLAVLLSKPPAPHEVVNDLDGDLVNFWRQLRERPTELARLCQLTPYARDEFALSRHLEDLDDDLERARLWWVRITQSYSRTSKPSSGWSNGTSRTGSRAASTLAYVDRMMAVAERLRTVTIDNRDAAEVIESYDTPETVHYVDPPYLGAARSSSWGSSYAVDMRDEQSHRRLAEILHDVAGTVFLSGYRSPLYDELYPDWPRWELDVTRGSGNRKGISPRATEVLWCNRPLREQLRLDAGEVPA